MCLLLVNNIKVIRTHPVIELVKEAVPLKCPFCRQSNVPDFIVGYFEKSPISNMFIALKILKHKGDDDKDATLIRENYTNVTGGLPCPL
jgi:hypothetical protein